MFRRVQGKGMVCVVRSLGDRVHSEVLGCFLRAVDVGAAVQVRIATGEKGDALLPTDAEFAATAYATQAIAEAQAAAERRARQEAEAQVEIERAAREAEQRAREETEKENARLREEIERLRGGGVKA